MSSVAATGHIAGLVMIVMIALDLSLHLLEFSSGYLYSWWCSIIGRHKPRFNYLNKIENKEVEILSIKQKKYE